MSRARVERAGGKNAPGRLLRTPRRPHYRSTALREGSAPRQVLSCCNPAADRGHAEGPGLALKACLALRNAWLASPRDASPTSEGFCRACDRGRGRTCVVRR